MIGAIRRVKYIGRLKEYTITDGRIEYVFEDSRTFHQGAIVSFELDGTTPINLSVLAEEEAKNGYNKIKDLISVGTAPTIIEDELIKKLFGKIQSVAKELVAARKTGRTVVVRFHGDADGICAALAINGICYVKSFQQNSAIYGVKDALRDIGNFGQENPLLLILDFGSSDQSFAGIELLRAAHIDFIIVDHHPVGKNKEVVNPFIYSENGSKYTAGLLACEIAATAGLDKNQAIEIARIACAGDKSTLLEINDRDKEKAMVLDFLAAHTSFGNNLEFYKKVMKNDELFNSILIQAKESINEIASKVSIKEKIGKVKVLYFNLEEVITKGEWPPSSKVTTKIFEDNNFGGPLVTLGYNERTIIIRINEEAEKLGLSANKIAEEIKSKMDQFVEGGGGHAKAGAIRIKKGFVESVLGEILRMIA